MSTKTFHWDAHTKTVSVFDSTRKLDANWDGGAIIPFMTGPKTHVDGVWFVQMLNDCMDGGVSFGTAFDIAVGGCQWFDKQ